MALGYAVCISIAADYCPRIVLSVKGERLMRKIVFCLVFLIAIVLSAAALGANNPNWERSPVITKAYEISSEHLYVEWEGNSVLYQVQVDGKKVMDVAQAKAIIPIKKGTHSIVVYPINAEKIAQNIISGKIAGIGTFEVDLSALGIGKNELTFGRASEKLSVDYTPDMIFSAVPDKLTASTVEKNNVKLSFIDRYNSDSYIITIKIGKDINRIQFNLSDRSAAYISRDNTYTSIVLNADYLSEQGCMIPEVNEKYQFQVQLRKYASNLVKNEKINTVMLDSKTSKWLTYTPIAAWKTAPVINFASQVADGQAKLVWEHENYKTDVEYSIIRNYKTLFVKTGEEVIGKTKRHEYVIDDLMNGNYSFTVVPNYQGEAGPAAEERTVEINNEWVLAPDLNAEQINNNQVKLTWSAPESVDEYLLTVYEGSSKSLLRFVDLDYKKVFETDIDVYSDKMEYIYTYDLTTGNEPAVRLKFEICGVHRNTSGEGLKSAVSRKSIEMK